MKRGRATIRIDLAASNADPELIAAALEPDNTPEMDARLSGDVLETRVERASAGGLQSTVDDYVKNLGVALRVAGMATDEKSSSAADDSAKRQE